MSANTATPAKNSKTPTTSGDKPDVTVNVPLPAELHKRLRIAAITEDLSVKDAVIAALEAWTQEHS